MLFVAGDYSLDIRDVALEDDGKYQCQVSSGLNGELCTESSLKNISIIDVNENIN